VLVVEIVVAVAVLVAVAFIASRPDIGGIDDPDTDHPDIACRTVGCCAAVTLRNCASGR
jgi:hypothetical protein